MDRTLIIKKKKWTIGSCWIYCKDTIFLNSCHSLLATDEVQRPESHQWCTGLVCQEERQLKHIHSLMNFLVCLYLFTSVVLSLFPKTYFYLSLQHYGPLYNPLSSPCTFHLPSLQAKPSHSHPPLLQGWIHNQSPPQQYIQGHHIPSWLGSTIPWSLSAFI